MTSTCNKSSKFNLLSNAASSLSKTASAAASSASNAASAAASNAVLAAKNASNTASSVASNAASNAVLAAKNASNTASSVASNAASSAVLAAKNASSLVNSSSLVNNAHTQIKNNVAYFNKTTPNFIMTFVLIVIAIIIIITSSLGYSINNKCSTVNELPNKLNKMSMGIGVGIILNIILRDLHFIGFTNFSIILLAIFLMTIGSVLINIGNNLDSDCQDALDKSFYTDIAFGLIGVSIGIIMSAVLNMVDLKGINSSRILAIMFSMIGIFVSSLVINMANSCTGNSVGSQKTIAVLILVIEILAVVGIGSTFYFMP